jgi:hypothetical protein
VTRYAVRKLPDEGAFGPEFWPAEERALVGLSEVQLDDWETRAGRLPHLEVEGEPGEVTAIDVIVRANEHLEGWAIRVRLLPADNGLRITHREERVLPPDVEEGVVITGPGENDLAPYRRVVSPEPMLLSSSSIQQVGLGNVSEHVKSLLTHAVIREQILGRGWPRPVVRPGRRQKDDHTYALWANRYVWALAQPGAARSPNTFIAAADSASGIPRGAKQVENRIRRSRDLGFLTRGERGRAGGELTQRSIDLLAELGVQPGSDHPVQEDQ